MAPFVGLDWHVLTVKDMDKLYGHKYKPSPDQEATTFASMRSSPKPRRSLAPKPAPYSKPTATEPSVFKAPVARMTPSQKNPTYNPAAQISRFTPFITTPFPRNFNSGPSPPLPTEGLKPIGDDHYSDWYALSDEEDDVHPFMREEEAIMSNIDPYLIALSNPFPEIGQMLPPPRPNVLRLPQNDNRFQPYPTARPSSLAQVQPYLTADISQQMGPPRIQMTNRTSWKKPGNKDVVPVEDIEAHMEKVVGEKTNKTKNVVEEKTSKTNKTKTKNNKRTYSRKGSMIQPTVSPPLSIAEFPASWNSKRPASEPAVPEEQSLVLPNSSPEEQVGWDNFWDSMKQEAEEFTEVESSQVEVIAAPKEVERPTRRLRSQGLVN